MRGVMKDFADHVKFATIAKGVSTNSSLSQAFDMDDEGNLYVAWSETGDGDRRGGIWYSSSGDQGRTWKKPVRVDTNKNTDIWPWVAVGDSGKVAISWLQNSTKIPGNDAEEAPEDSGWSVMVGHTHNGLGCGDDPRVAGFKVTKASSRPVHMGTICQGGTLCQAFAIDRRLGDYFADEIDSRGGHTCRSPTRAGGVGGAAPRHTTNRRHPVHITGSPRGPAGPHRQGRR